MFNPKQLEETQLIDLGHISEYNGSGNNFLRTDLIAFYRAPETYSNQFDYRSDIYSIIAVLYSMVLGKNLGDSNFLKGWMQMRKKRESEL